jgi:hypothetical protein
MKSRNALASELKAFSQSGSQARSFGSLGDRPLVVLTAGKMMFGHNPLMTDEVRDQIMNAWMHEWINVLQVEQAHLSTRGRQIIVPDSTHVIQFERPDAVISAVREVRSAVTATH